METVNSTHKCNLSVRPFVMVAKLAKKYSGEVRMPSFFLGLLFNLFRMKIIARTVLRTFSLGKSPINPHVKIFPSVLKCRKNLFFTLKKPFFCLRKTVFSYLPLRGKFLQLRSFCFPMRFSQVYRPHVQGRKRRNRGEVCLVVSTTGKVSVRWYRLGSPGFIGSSFPRMIWMCKVNIYTEGSGNVLMSAFPLSVVAVCSNVRIDFCFSITSLVIQVLFRTVILFQHCLYKPA